MGDNLTAMADYFEGASKYLSNPALTKEWLRWAAELRQLRRENERLRAVAEAAKRFADRPLIATLRDDLKAALKALEAP